MNIKSIMLLSGGLDSAVSLAFARHESEVSLCLTFDYGQQAAENEKKAAAAFAKHYQLPHQIISMPFLHDITHTALVRGSSMDIPEPLPIDLSDHVTSAANAAQVWVPNRNGLFINVAVAFAESLGANLVVTGFNKEEADLFPDNSEDFVKAINLCLKHSVINPVNVVSYTQRLDKIDIVKLGQRLSLPFQYIWSCYRSGGKMCGRCESCMRLKRAASIADLSMESLNFSL